MRSLAAALVSLAAACASNPQPATAVGSGSQVVILVRHAEKASDEADPTLSATGRTRAAALAETLRHSGITRVIVSHRRRTGETAEPLTRPAGIVPDTVPVGRSVAEHVRAVARRVREGRGAVTLVVGHSNTIPGIVAELTGVPLPDLCDADYASLFIVTLPATGPGRFVRARFGAADESATRCGVMTPR